MVSDIVRGVARRHRHGVAVAVVLLATSAGSAAGQEPPLKIGVLNVDLVALQSPAGKALQQQTADFQLEITQELQVLQEAARAIESEVAAADSLSQEARRDLERRYQDALTNFQRYQQDKQEEAAALRTEGMNRIQQEISPAIESIQAELGYDLVLNSQNTLVVIFSERIDITQLVIDRLQAEGAGAP